MFIFGRQQKARRPLLEYRERKKLHFEEKLDREKKSIALNIFFFLSFLQVRQERN